MVYDRRVMQQFLHVTKEMVYGCGRTLRDIVKFVDVFHAMWSKLWMYSLQCGQVSGCTSHYMVEFVDVLLANVFKECQHRP